MQMETDGYHKTSRLVSAFSKGEAQKEEEDARMKYELSMERI